MGSALSRLKVGAMCLRGNELMYVDIIDNVDDLVYCIESFLIISCVVHVSKARWVIRLVLFKMMETFRPDYMVDFPQSGTGHAPLRTGCIARRWVA